MLFSPNKSLQTPLRTVSPWLAWLLIALPVLLFASIALRFVENIPWYDDVEMFIVFIQDFYKVDTIHDKIYWLLEPNNEHRILFAKLAALFTYLTTGHMNFRGMTLIGNLFLFFSLGLLYTVFRSMRLSIWAFVPIPFILLHPQYFMTISWSITSLQHPVVLFLSCSVMYLLSRSGRNRFLWAIPLQIFASLSMSNALFGWISGGLILWRQGHYRRLIIWLVTGVITMILYVQGFTNAQGHGQSLDFLIHKPHLVVIGFLSFIGGSFDLLPLLPYQWRGILPTIGGLLLVGTALWLVSQMNWPFRRQFSAADNRSVRSMNNNFFLGCYGLLLINATAVGLLRMRYGYGVMLVSNYMIYPALLACLLYLNGLQEVSQRQRVVWHRIGMIAGLLIWTVSYFWHLPEMLFRNKFVLAAAYNQEHNGIGLGGQVGTFLEGYINTALDGAVKQGYYVFPDSPVADYPISLDPLPAVVRLANETYIIESDGPPEPIDQAYAVLQSPGHTYLAPTKTPYRLATFWLHRPSTVLQAELRASDLRAGTYRVGWARASSAGKSIQFSDQLIVVK
ncbi:MAG: hypothetical protein EOO39_05480 [Cytophagaceae bacterium]|nr:MAG: hypothetical protein EOO39_05480 [Cytophagaceae bacterium]